MTPFFLLPLSSTPNIHESNFFLFFRQTTSSGGAIRVGSIVRAALGVSRGVLSNGARGRVIEDDGTSRPYKVQALEGADTNWFRAEEVVLADSPVITTTTVSTRFYLIDFHTYTLFC